MSAQVNETRNRNDHTIKRAYKEHYARHVDSAYFYLIEYNKSDPTKLNNTTTKTTAIGTSLERISPSKTGQRRWVEKKTLPQAWGEDTQSNCGQNRFSTLPRASYFFFFTNLLL